jgi:hypothetical protein
MTDEPQNDPARPNFVWAKSPPFIGGDYCFLYTPPDTVRRWYHGGKATKIAEYVGLVHGVFPDPRAYGRPPPAQYDEREPAPEIITLPPGTTGLLRPSAIFQGLRRPMWLNGRDAGSLVAVYVTEPDHSYTYPPDDRMGNHPTPIPVPTAAVFTTFVSFEAVDVDVAVAAMQKPPPRPIHGVVLFWEWTVASAGAAAESFSDRYERHLS